MIHINNLKLRFSGQIIFNNISLHIKRDDRTGLIGPNGAGKTTLFRTITQLQAVDDGTIRLAKDVTLGYLPQETIEMKGKTVLEETLSVFDEAIQLGHNITRLQAQIEQVANEKEPSGILHQLGEMQHRFENLGGYTIESAVKRILAGLGFSETDFHKRIETFSGGWQMRVALAKLLALKPSLLLLDEPTNHLDIKTMEWLEDYLHNYSGAIMLVSHDRFFLDRVVKKIYALERGEITEYVGNYSFYESERAKREDQLWLEYERQKDEIARVQRFIERFRYKASKAAQVQARIKMLEKMERIIPPQQSKQIRFRFPSAPRSGRVIMELEQVGMHYGNNQVFADIELKLVRNERVALVGENGAGKSTLSRILAQKISSTSGQVKMGYNVKIGFYSQEFADELQGSATVLEELMKAAGTMEQTRLRSLLGSFLFTGDEVFKPVSVLSGGEKSRLALAKILVQPTNFLILDEPTNHLDLQAKDVLRDALLNFDGTLVLVSHDRYFLNKIVTRVLELADGRIIEYLGNYSYYLDKKSQNPIENDRELLSKRQPTSSDKKTKEQKRLEAEARNRLSQQKRQFKEKLDVIESEIAALENKKQQLETILSDSAIFKDEIKARQTNREYKTLAKKLERLYSQWEVATENWEMVNGN